MGFVSIQRFDGRSRGVFWLANKSLDAACAFIFADTAGRHCVVSVTMKDKALRLIAPSDHSAGSDFFQRIEAYLTTSHRVVLPGD